MSSRIDQKVCEVLLPAEVANEATAAEAASPVLLATAEFPASHGGGHAQSRPRIVGGTLPRALPKSDERCFDPSRRSVRALSGTP